MLLSAALTPQIVFIPDMSMVLRALEAGSAHSSQTSKRRYISLMKIGRPLRKPATSSFVCVFCLHTLLANIYLPMNKPHHSAHVLSCAARSLRARLSLWRPNRWINQMGRTLVKDLFSHTCKETGSRTRLREKNKIEEKSILRHGIYLQRVRAHVSPIVK